MIFSKANLFKLKKALLSLKEVSTKEGVTLITDDDTFEVGMEVFVDGEDGLEPAKDGEYTVNDNIVTVEGGKIVSIVEPPIEQPTEEEVVEEPVTEEVVEEVVEPPSNEETTEEVTEEVTEVEDKDEKISELEGIIEEQKTLIETLKAENEDLKKKLEEPAAELAEEEFKNQKPVEKEMKIDFSQYIKKRNK
jgi:hypothetical protein